MQETAKYLIHANLTANGVVERSDVVGAVFGQTEGLLGEDLDLRDLQESSKVGRIDVEITSERGQTFGQVTIASGMDKVETAILAAALETIERVGPCRATVEVDRLEDIRAAKRREVVERAKDLLASFEGEVLSSQELIDEVRRSVRVEDIEEHEGLPAGPRVADSDAIIIVEGRADVLQLLEYGIKNAIAVEGTDVPTSVAHLTQERTVTAFLDGDRGGDLILKELQQVASVDYVTFPPAGKSVEDLARDEVLSALREKVPADAVSEAASPHETVAATDGSTRPAPPEATGESVTADVEPETPDEPSPAPEDTEDEESKPATDADETEQEGESDPGDVPEPDSTDASAEEAVEAPEDGANADAAASADAEPDTLAGYVASVIDGETAEAVLLDEDWERLATAEAADAFEAIVDSEAVPTAVVLDGTVSQRLLDVAAQRGVEQIAGRDRGEYVKQPVAVRVRTAEEFE